MRINRVAPGPAFFLLSHVFHSVSHPAPCCRPAGRRRSSLQRRPTLRDCTAAAAAAFAAAAASAWSAGASSWVSCACSCAHFGRHDRHRADRTRCSSLPLASVAIFITMLVRQTRAGPRVIFSKRVRPRMRPQTNEDGVVAAADMVMSVQRTTGDVSRRTRVKLSLIDWRRSIPVSINTAAIDRVITVLRHNVNDYN